MIHGTKLRNFICCAAIAAAAFAQPLAAQVLYTENGFFGNTVGSYSAITGAPINPALVTVPFGFSSIAVDNQGNLYTDNYFEGIIGKYNAATGAAINPSLVSGFDGPPMLYAVSIAVDNAGQLFVSSGSGLYTFDSTTGAQIGSAITTGTEYVATDSADDLFVANPSWVSEYGPGGTLLWSDDTALNSIQDLAVDSDGDLFTADGSTGTVSEFDAATGQLLNPDFITGLGWAVSVATDNSGDLFVSSQNSIGEYSAVTGAVINADLISQGGDLIRFHAAAPEATGTIGLFVIGLVGLSSLRCAGRVRGRA
ncbi:MAG TPA: hypothetical protein VFE31_13450 [Opitutaceae bacterium]|jgi:hypothetical protein|nr:hypothetical protein [Opitutaceae bacterium]